MIILHFAVRQSAVRWQAIFIVQQLQDLSGGGDWNVFPSLTMMGFFCIIRRPECFENTKRLTLSGASGHLHTRLEPLLSLRMQSAVSNIV